MSSSTTTPMPTAPHRLKYFCLSVLFFGSHLLFAADNPPQKSEDYKKWTLGELLFTIDSGLLDPETRLEYIECYLQKAKRENSQPDIITAYQKKIANLEDYTLKTKYADSLLAFSLKLANNQLIGEAYDYKGYVESTVKNYEKALAYRLKAKDYLKGTDDLYTLNKVKSSIGYIYYHLEDYEKAYALNLETTTYYYSHRETSYNHKKRYVINLGNLSKSAFRLGKYDTLQILIETGYAAVKELKAHHQPLETAYFSLMEGLYHHHHNDYATSDSLILAALPEIEANNDFANQHLGYLYLGKNARQQNQNQKALNYFMKIDSLYQTKDFINAELSEAYTYIIAHYQQQRNPQKQLFYTNILLKIAKNLGHNNKQLSSYLHQNHTIKQLEASKTELENQLSRADRQSVILYVLLIIVAFAFVLSLYLIYTHKKNLKTKFGKLIDRSKLIENPESETLTDEEFALLPRSDQKILRKLRVFEQEERYLQKAINLATLAQEFETNRTTLSQTINKHKNNTFNGYINKLRVNYAVNLLLHNPEAHTLFRDDLAEKVGFGSRKRLLIAFKEVTGMSLSEFLKLKKQTG